MGESFVWWILLELLGLVALPIAAIAFRSLPDRGYSISKVLGLLLTGWLAYTLSIMQLAQFTRGLLYFSLVALAALSGWLLWRNNNELLTRLRAHYLDRGTLRYILAAEVLFTLTFVFWTVMRAYSPDIFSTEKFMDFGFMNSVVRSETFPPNDMWLAGYPINYYYFGYVLMGSLSMLSGVPTEIAYNLANSTIPALLALGIFGLLFNLIRLSQTDNRPGTLIETWSTAPDVPRRRTRPQSSRSSGALPVRRAVRSEAVVIKPAGRTTVIEREPVLTTAETIDTVNGHSDEAGPIVQAVEQDDLYELVEPDLSAARHTSLLATALFGLLAALMVVAMGHMTTMFAVKQGNPLEGNGWRYCFACQTPQNFDWWGPSRVIKDYKVTDTPGLPPQKQASGIDAINEFPAFSFVLADMHPHVMALILWPLALSVGLAFATRRVRRLGTWRDGLPSGLRGWITLAVAAIAIGALYTTNTWDYPTFLLIALAAVLLPHLAFRRMSPSNDRVRWLRPIIVESGLLVILSFVSFLFFHLTFKSLVGSQEAQLPENLANIPVIGWFLEKAGSLLLVNTWDKAITGFLVIFGIFLFGIVGWLIYEVAAPSLGPTNVQARNRVLLITVATTLLSLLLALLFRFPMLALGLPIIVASVLLIWRDPEAVVRNLVLSILALTTLIAVSIEVVYLRDVFNDRQNTIFKFYYQIWVLYAVVAAYGVWRVLAGVWRSQPMGANSHNFRNYEEQASTLVRALSGAWAALFLLLVASGLMYGVYAPWKRVIDSGSRLWGLDGTAHLARSAPGDYEAIRWLKANTSGSARVLECCHDEYNFPGHAGRVSSYTGIPTLISWGGHEAQWRGGQPELLAEAGVRRQVTNDIYTAKGGSMGAQEMLSLLHQYGVNYVFVGATERGEGSAAGAYPEERVTPQAEALFKQIMSPAYTSGSTVIYKVPNAVPGGAQNSVP